MSENRSWRGFLVGDGKARKRLGVELLLLIAVLAFCYLSMIRMPGSSFEGALPPSTARQTELSRELRESVRVLADEIGARNVGHPEAYARAEEFLVGALRESGWSVQRQLFECDGQPCANIVVEARGTRVAEEIGVGGAHYASCATTPGADDNASGCAAILALAAGLHGREHARTLRLLLFANEEPPYYRTESMGSLVYARACRAAEEKIVAMLSLEMLGHYSDEAASQDYPAVIGWAYPDTADFLAFAGNWSSRVLVRDCIDTFRRSADFPSEGAALPSWSGGVGLSDNWSFWQAGYPALMVTDTAFFRNRNYHELSDTSNTLDYGRMARVVEGLELVVLCLLDEA